LKFPDSEVDYPLIALCHQRKNVIHAVPSKSFTITPGSGRFCQEKPFAFHFYSSKSKQGAEWFNHIPRNRQAILVQIA
jgi:hypothetical protein